MFPPKYGTASGPSPNEFAYHEKWVCPRTEYTIKECQRCKIIGKMTMTPWDLGAFGFFSQTATNEDFTHMGAFTQNHVFHWA